MRATFLCLVLLGCSGTVEDDGAIEGALSPTLDHGKTVWFNSTFGGEKFFSLIAPNAPFSLHLGFDLVLTSNRDTRFDEWGVLNDPDCTQGDATTGYLDKCTDPESAGVVGIRKKIVNGQVLVGVSCASCHAGLDPGNPPRDPNHPAWENIHATVGNQFIEIGKIFRAHMAPSDPRYQVFSTWAPGTVDTTAIENDHINNPGIITQFFNVTDRPYFNLTDHGAAIRVHRGGQGGEDDAGCEKAALRVYFNIGMCAAECMLPHLANGPGGTQTPIDQDECRARCPEYAQAESAVGDLCAFIATTRPPKIDPHYVDNHVVDRGKNVFQKNCNTCHSGAVLSDDLIHPMAEIGTNSCRARTTNWAAGHIWANFSSDQYKARPTGGPNFYRDMPLLGIWATAPFFHNNRLGVYSGDQSVAGRVAAYEEAMYELLHPLSRDYLGSIQVTSVTISIPTPIGPLPLPAGTPVAAFANLDPTNPLNNLCPDIIENEGHAYGAWLSENDKYALTEYLKTR